MARILLEGPVTETVTGPVSGAGMRQSPLGRGFRVLQVATYSRTGQLGRGAFSGEWPLVEAWWWRKYG